MWSEFQVHRVNWLLSSSFASSSRIDKAKAAYEECVLNLLLPAVVDANPVRLAKRESPDFEVLTSDGSIFVELVDAVPDGTSEQDSMNLARRRAEKRKDMYWVDPRQFAGVIARVIQDKQQKARKWALEEPRVATRLVLLVNGGQGPLGIREYMGTSLEINRLLGIRDVAPFAAVVLGDEMGAYVWKPTPIVWAPQPSR